MRLTGGEGLHPDAKEYGRGTHFFPYQMIVMIAWLTLVRWSPARVVAGITKKEDYALP
jgi:hypothetical protein